MTKQAKKDVDYSKGMPASHCGICRYFRSLSHTCVMVEGKISSEYWCKLFKKK